MSTFKVRKKRNFEEISPEEIMNMFKTQPGSKKLKIQYDIDDTPIEVNEFIDNDTVMVVTTESYEPGDSNIILAYGLIKKYIEVEFHAISKVAPGYFKCQIHSGRRAISGRTDIRFKVNKGDVVATNFKLSKHTINFSMFSVPTTIKVILDQFQAQNKGKYDTFNVAVFDKPVSVLKEISKTGKTLFIEDVNDVEGFAPISDDFINLKEVLGNEYPRYMKKNIERGYKSIMIVPILYITEEERLIPFGYIEIISKEEHFTIGDVISMKEKTFKLVDRIRDANTMQLHVKQRIVDVSKNGIRMEVDDPNLVKYLVKAKGFVFDIVFKLQAPITVYGEIKYTGQEGKKMILGLSIAGNSSRKNEMRRFFQILQPMEIEYKKKLVEQMRKRAMRSS